MTYYTHTLFIDCGFNKLKLLTSIYFSQLGLVTGENDKDDLGQYPYRWPQIDRNEDNIPRAEVCVYLCRNEYSLVGSGIDISLLHYREALQSKSIQRSYVPKEILTRLQNFPNAIQIRSHHLWPATGFFFARDFAFWLTKRKCRTLMLTCDSELLKIKQNPLLSLEEKLEAITNYALNFDDAQSLRVTKNRLKKQFAPNWKLLDKKTQRFLTTGMHLYESYDEGTGSICLDGSPISISLSKALENEINKKILEPYREYFLANCTNISPNEKRDPALKYIVKYLTDGHYLEMGKFAYFLRTALTDQSKRHFNIVGSFKAFISTRSEPDFFLDIAQFHDRLKQVVEIYRNPSAHPEVITFDKVTAFLSDLLGTDTDKGLLIKLVDASK